MSIEINFLTSMKALISKNADIFKNITNYVILYKYSKYIN